MKQNLFLIAVLLILSVSINSCSSEELVVADGVETTKHEAEDFKTAFVKFAKQKSLQGVGKKTPEIDSEMANASVVFLKSINYDLNKIDERKNSGDENLINLAVSEFINLQQTK